MNLQLELTVSVHIPEDYCLISRDADHLQLLCVLDRVQITPAQKNYINLFLKVNLVGLYRILYLHNHLPYLISENLKTLT